MPTDGYVRNDAGHMPATSPMRNPIRSAKSCPDMHNFSVPFYLPFDQVGVRVKGARRGMGGI